MRTARPLGLTPDGTALIVVADDGEHVAVVADERLRAALRRDLPRLGQLEIDMESALRPRHIQMRIRAGESVEDVARAAGVPVERLDAFAAPVIAEREHVAGLAQTSPVRRRGETSGQRQLRQAVVERLLSRGVDIDDVIWDAWKEEDRRWAVKATYQSGSATHEALFSYDQLGRFSVAANDDARWLISDQSPSHGPQPGRHRVPGPDSEPTVDLDDELALVRATQDAPQPLQPPDDAPEVPPVTLHEPAVDVSTRGQEGDSEGAAENLEDAETSAAFLETDFREVNGVYDIVPTRESDLDVLYDMLSNYTEDSVRLYAGLNREPTDETPAPASTPAPSGEPASEATEGTPEDAQPVTPARKAQRAQKTRRPQGAQAGAAEAAEPAPAVQLAQQPSTPAAQSVEDAAVPASDPVVPSPTPAAARPRPRRKRAAVPSWDEIMFGGPTPRQPSEPPQPSGDEDS